MSDNTNWKPRVLIIGAMIGAALGLMAGFLYVRVADESGGPAKVSTGNAVKLGLAALAVVRQASQLGD